MNCPICNGKTGVLRNIRNLKDEEMYRRRECKSCGHRFWTTEILVEETAGFLKTLNRWYQAYREGLKCKED